MRFYERCCLFAQRGGVGVKKRWGWMSLEFVGGDGGNGGESCTKVAGSAVGSSFLPNRCFLRFYITSRRYWFALLINLKNSLASS